MLFRFSFTSSCRTIKQALRLLGATSKSHYGTIPFYNNLLLYTLDAEASNSARRGGKELMNTYYMAWQVFDTTKNQAVGEIEDVQMCTDFTGEGVTLNKALNELQLILSSYSNCCIATTNSFYLRQILYPELTRKLSSSSHPPIIDQFFDLQRELAKKLNRKFQPRSLIELCESIGVDCPSGDSCNGKERIQITSTIVQKLLAQGHIFETPEIIQQNYQHCDTVNLDDIGAGCIVKLKGLPFLVIHNDVALFLSGLNIIPGGIVLGINSFEMKNGEAIVVLENEEQAHFANMRQYQYLYKRYIEVHPATLDQFLEFRHNNAAFIKRNSWNTVKAQGLPHNVHECDLVKFFANFNYDIKESDVEIVYSQSGSPKGVAYINFSSSEIAQQAIEELNHKFIGRRYVELSLVS